MNKGLTLEGCKTSESLNKTWGSCASQGCPLGQPSLRKLYFLHKPKEHWTCRLAGKFQSTNIILSPSLKNDPLLYTNPRAGLAIKFSSPRSRIQIWFQCQRPRLGVKWDPVASKKNSNTGTRSVLSLGLHKHPNSSETDCLSSSQKLISSFKHSQRMDCLEFYPGRDV